jgi:hypothetical protein
MTAVVSLTLAVSNSAVADDTSTLTPEGVSSTLDPTISDVPEKSDVTPIPEVIPGPTLNPPNELTPEIVTSNPPTDISIPEPSPMPTELQTPNNDGEVPTIPGYSDEYLMKWEKVQIAQNNRVNANERLKIARSSLGIAGTTLRSAQRAVVVAKAIEEIAQKQLDASARGMYQSGSGSLGIVIAVVTSPSNDSLSALEFGYMLNKVASATTSDFLVIVENREASEKFLISAQFNYDEALMGFSEAQKELETVSAEYADAISSYGDAINFSGPQTEVGPDGCPVAAPVGTLRDGAENIGISLICQEAVKQAATPQAAFALKWGLTRLGAPYACKGIGRMNPFRFDCSSLVSRAYWEGAGIPIAGDSWAPSTRNMTPWDGVALDPHLAQVDPMDIKPGDLVLYNTCPQGGCGYRHVVMYLGSTDGGKTNWMLQTNSCGDTAHVKNFNGFGPETNFEVVRRVMTIGEEIVRPAAIVNPSPEANN